MDSPKYNPDNSIFFVSEPINEYGEYQRVSWNREIYPQFKGEVDKEEAKFFAHLIKSTNAKSVCDFAIGGGNELVGVVQVSGLGIAPADVPAVLCDVDVVVTQRLAV